MKTIFSNLDLSQNILLESLKCYDNQISNLDLSNNNNLKNVDCHNNQLISLNLKNGSNISDSLFVKHNNNPNLYCIQVDDVFYSANYWQGDLQSDYDTDCGFSAIKDHTTNKELLKITDLLGRETKQKKSTSILYL